MIRVKLWSIVLPLAAAVALPVGVLAQQADPGGRIAIITAFAPEFDALEGLVDGASEHRINGNLFLTGRLEGKDIVLVQSGMSMVNATMTTQIALDRFDADGIVFSGVGGGADPSLTIGDVVVPDRWGQYLEVLFARKTEHGFEVPSWISSWMAPEFPNYEMMFTMTVEVVSARQEGTERRFWFPVDEEYLALAEEVAGSIALAACDAENNCLRDPPEMIVGGSGVSGPTFVDNAAYRDYVYETFEAHVLDMESAAVAHVAYANEVPFIVFRSLSDLAGGNEQENEFPIFLELAAANSAAVVRAFLAAMD